MCNIIFIENYTTYIDIYIKRQMWKYLNDFRLFILKKYVYSLCLFIYRNINTIIINIVAVQRIAANIFTLLH